MEREVISALRGGGDCRDGGRANPHLPAHRVWTSRGQGVTKRCPLGQAGVDLAVEGGKLMVGLKTLTPNFTRFEIRRDDGEWGPSAAAFEWKLRPGVSRLEARTVNAFGITGPVSTADVEVE